MQWTCIFTGYDVAKLRDNSDITGDQAHKTWKITSPSTTRQVTTMPTDPLSWHRARTHSTQNYSHCNRIRNPTWNLPQSRWPQQTPPQSHLGRNYSKHRGSWSRPSTQSQQKVPKHSYGKGVLDLRRYVRKWRDELIIKQQFLPRLQSTLSHN